MGPAPMRIGKIVTVQMCVEIISGQLCASQDTLLMHNTKTAKPEAGSAIFLCHTSSADGNIWICEDGSCSGNKTFTMDDVNPTLRPDEVSSSYSEVFAWKETTATAQASASRSSDSSCAGSYSSVQMAGVGVGIGVPLLFAFLAMLWLYLAEKKQKVVAQNNAKSAFELHDQRSTAWSAGHAIDSKAQGKPPVPAELPPHGQSQELPVHPAELPEETTESCP